MAPRTMEMIATAGIATPVAALSFVVKLEEISAAAELIAGREELLFEAGEGIAVVADGVVAFVGIGPDVALIDVALIIGTRSAATSSFPPTPQLV